MQCTKVFELQVNCSSVTRTWGHGTWGHSRSRCPRPHTKHSLSFSAIQEISQDLPISGTQSSLATGGFWGLEQMNLVDNPGMKPNISILKHFSKDLELSPNPLQLRDWAVQGERGRREETRGNPRVSVNSCLTSFLHGFRALGWEPWRKMGLRTMKLKTAWSRSEVQVQEKLTGWSEEQGHRKATMVGPRWIL